MKLSIPHGEPEFSRKDAAKTSENCVFCTWPTGRHAEQMCCFAVSARE